MLLNIDHLWIIFPLKPPFTGDFPLPCEITRGYPILSPTNIRFATWNPTAQGAASSKSLKGVCWTSTVSLSRWRHVGCFQDDGFTWFYQRIYIYMSIWKTYGVSIIKSVCKTNISTYRHVLLNLYIYICIWFQRYEKNEDSFICT